MAVVSYQVKTFTAALWSDYHLIQTAHYFSLNDILVALKGMTSQVELGCMLMMVLASTVCFHQKFLVYLAMKLTLLVLHMVQRMNYDEKLRSFLSIQVLLLLKLSISVIH